MSTGKSFSFFYLLKAIIAGGLLMATLTSCFTAVKKYPRNKPFVYKTNINVIGDFSRSEKESLVGRLEDQLDDSMRARRVDWLLWNTLKNPPAYDKANAEKSIGFMHALLLSLGYFSDSIAYNDTLIKKGEDQLRTTITFNVKPGRLWTLDTVVYNMEHPELQHLADSTRKDAMIKKGDAFAKVPISSELDRLTELYRNNGYFRFSRNELVGLWDTLDVALLQPSLDPFEQLRILQELKERRKKPTVDLELRLRTFDSSRLRKYYNGTITIFPDYSIDTFGIPRKEAIVNGIKVVQFHNKFKPKIFPPNIYLPRGTEYSQRRYLRTINRFNTIGAWQLVNIDVIPRPSTDTVDYVLKLTPAKKRLLSLNLEGSFNQSTISGNLFGIGVNGGLQNRNFLKAANQANTNIRYGVEFGATGSKQFIQSKQASLGHKIYFPRAIVFNKIIPDNRKDNIRSVLSLNLSNTDRRLLFNLTTLNASLGYEYQRRNFRHPNRNMLLNVAFPFPNIEYSFLDKRDSLNNLIKNNPSLRNIFTDGLIFSWIANLTLSGGKDNHFNIFRTNFEAAPLFAGWIHSPFLDSQIYRFIKIDAEFARLIKYPKNSIALRVFAGVGIADPFNSTVNPLKRNALPFFKQYFSGGPNSMRAWALRTLGPGSVIKDYSSNPDRYGDVQLEANAEFRFPIFRPFGIPVNGALFTDIGNVWFLKAKAGTEEEVFHLGRLGHDIAVGSGAGLRIDFGFFIVRLDYAYKVKDPSPPPAFQNIQNKWFGYKFFDGDQFQLGIGYPFIF